jgi:hypothetical protein
LDAINDLLGEIMSRIDAEYLQSYITLCEKHLQGDLNLDDANQALKALNETSSDCSYNVIKHVIMGGRITANGTKCAIHTFVTTAKCGCIESIPEPTPRIGATLRALGETAPLDLDEVPNDWYDSGCVPDYDDYYDWQSSNC